MVNEATYGRDVATQPSSYEILFHIHLLSCPVCDMPSVASRLDDDDELEWISTGVRGKDFPDVPEEIAASASEAHICSSAGGYRAAILMARSVVEAACKEKGITSGRLVDKLSQLHSGGFINDQVHAEATEIRHMGNDMAHGDFGAPVTEADAQEMLAFMAEVLEEVFQRPARLARRQATRAVGRQTSGTN
ncbi:MAG: DUF4145 domain-containing protein [Propionicimonas sp.]|nr:DUF4145 domain-containing protein [Propionicimonas sp.]